MKKKLPRNLAENIRRLKAAGHYQGTIPLYRSLIGISADDEETVADLADTMLVIEEKQGRASMLAFLAEIAVDNVGIYRSVAELLRRLDREDELLAVLQKIHGLDPGDIFATQEKRLWRHFFWWTCLFERIPPRSLPPAQGYLLHAPAAAGLR